MKIYYRMSDSSYDKPKLPGVGKRECFDNFLTVFQNEDIEVIADNCLDSTLQWLHSTRLPITITRLGNAGSLRHILQAAMKLPLDTTVYACEDDYLHKPRSVELIEEIKDRTDYFTLYDHPDKYTEDYQFGEVSKVIRTPSSHWRFTRSTCMTFGCKVRTLQEDWMIWDKFTTGPHPHDHFIFTELGQKGRLLAVPIPGFACHTDLTFSNGKGQNSLEDWAIRYAINQLRIKLSPETPEFLFYEEHLVGNDLWGMLMLLSLRCQVLNNPIRNSKAGD